METGCGRRSHAKTVRRRNGKVSVTDGPFAETHEWIAGFDLLECDTIDRRSRSRRGIRWPRTARSSCVRSGRSNSPDDGRVPGRAVRVAPRHPRRPRLSAIAHAPRTTLVGVTERAPLSRKLVRHRRVRDAQGRREGEGPAGRRPAGHLLRRGRARLRDAAVHRGCRGRGAARPGELPLHAGRRPAGAARGDRREDAARLGPRGRRIPDRRHQRRQAGRLSGVPGGREPGRRGAAARAVLDDVPRGDRARRRRARRGVRRRRPGLQGHRRAARGRAHRQAPRCSSSSRPSNPTGSVYTPEETRAIGEWAVEHGIWIISDEIYQNLVYEGARAVSIVEAVPDAAAQTILVNGVAKTYAMTGWRVGWMVGPKDAIKLAANLQSHLCSQRQQHRAARRARRAHRTAERGRGVPASPSTAAAG